jgi:hypothetical protein
MGGAASVAERQRRPGRVTGHAGRIRRFPPRLAIPNRPLQSCAGNTTIVIIAILLMFVSFLGYYWWH